MDSNGFNYGVRARWRGRVETPAEIGERVLRTLDGLSPVNEVMKHWSLLDYCKMRGAPRAVERDAVEALVAGGVVRDDLRRPEPESGYHLHAVNRLNLERPADPRDLTLSIHAGSRWSNEVHFEAGHTMQPPDLSVVTCPIFKGALCAIVANWPCAWATAYAFTSGYDKASSAPGVAPIPYTQHHIPWMGYLPRPLAFDLSLPADIRVEPAPGGGVFMIATADRFDPYRPDHMTRARILSEVMADRAG